MNDFKDLDLDYFAPRTSPEPTPEPKKDESTYTQAPAENRENDRTNENAPEPAERPRKAKPSRRELLNTRLSVLSVGVMVILFALVTLFLIVFPRSEVSQIENRNLAQFPKFSFSSYFSGAYTSDIATWYDDTVPFHDGFKNMSNTIKNMFGMKMFASSGSTAKPETDTTDNTESNAGSDTQTNTPANGSVTDGTNLLQYAAGRVFPAVNAADEKMGRDYTAENNDTLEWLSNLVMVNWDNHWRCMEIFGGGGGTAYADALNDLQSKVDSGVTVWSMPAPTSGAFYMPKNGLEYVADQKECFDGIAAKLNAGIQSVNVVDVIKKHSEEEIYLRTDHHWQARGAYYAARTFAEAAGVPFADLSTYTEKSIPGFVGTMYGFSQDTRILNDPDDFHYFVPASNYVASYYDSSFNYLYEDDLFAEVDTANAYLTFLGGDSYIVKVDTQMKNGRKLLVIKDSFGNAEIPFYTNSFEQIYVADVRELQCNLVSFIKDMGITDVLFTMSAFSVVGDNADNIANLISQNAGETITDSHIVASVAPETVATAAGANDTNSTDSASSADSTNSTDSTDTADTGSTVDTATNE